MAKLDKTDFTQKYQDASNGSFKDNETGEISETTIRAFAQDINDSFLSATDNFSNDEAEENDTDLKAWNIDAVKAYVTSVINNTNAITENIDFTGILFFGNVLGTIYNDYTATSNITLGVGTTPKNGAVDSVKIAPGGFTVTIPNTWIKRGGDDFSNTNGDVNDINFFYKNGEVQYNNYVQAADDTTPPVFSSAPSAVPSSSSASVSLTLNESGTAYMVVLNENDPEPSRTQIVAGQDSFGAAATSTSGIGTVITLDVTGLTGGQNYDAWIIAEDTAGNLQNASVLVQFTTTITDTTPPSFTTTPSPVATETDVSVDFTINETGTVYAVVVPRDEGAPSSSQVKAGQNSNSLSSPSSNATGTNVLINITGLVTGTLYDLYYVAEDTAGNLQTSASLLQFSTVVSDSTPPSFTVAPSVSDLDYKAFNVNAEIDETGTIYIVIVPDNETAPTPAQVKAGQNGLGVSANWAKSGGNGVFSFNNFLMGTAYDVYLVAEDGSGNLQTAVTKLDTTTNTLSGTVVFESSFTDSFADWTNVGFDNAVFGVDNVSDGTLSKDGCMQGISIPSSTCRFNRLNTLSTGDFNFDGWCFIPATNSELDGVGLWQGTGQKVIQDYFSVAGSWFRISSLNFNIVNTNTQLTLQAREGTSLAQLPAGEVIYFADLILTKL